MQNTTKKLVVDARMIVSSGIGVYIQNYVIYILEKNLFNVVLLGNISTLKKFFGHYPNCEFIEADFPIYSIKEQIHLPKLIPQCDLFWSPHYNTPLLPIKAKKRVISVADTAHITLSRFFKFSLAKRLYSNLVLRIGTYISDEIITISNFSKEEILRYTSVRENKLHVVYLGVDGNLFGKKTDQLVQERVKKQYRLPDKFLLFVGNIKPHKNLKSLIESFATIMDNLPDLNIVIVGKREGFITGDTELFEKIDKNIELKERIFFTGYVETEDLPTIYSLAQLFVFPSVYEGFGFPPLEAMSTGTPVAASNAASIPEICQDGAIYFDPFNIEKMAKSIFSLASDSILRDKLIKNGFTISKSYQWDTSCSQFVTILKSLVK